MPHVCILYQQGDRQIPYQAFLYCSSWGSPNTLIGHLGLYSLGVLLRTVLALPNSLISS